MPDSELTLEGLYDWACRIEDELEDYKAVFPERLSLERRNCVMSFRCLRISVELMVAPRMVKRPPPGTGRRGPQDASPQMPR